MSQDKYSYRVSWSEEDGEYLAQCAEFPSLSWLARTQESALKGLRKTVADVVEDMMSTGEDVPLPIALRTFSGKFVVRVPPELHRKLALHASENKVSLNRWVSSKLAES